jgi:hypothetical protein
MRLRTRGPSGFIEAQAQPPTDREPVQLVSRQQDRGCRVSVVTDAQVKNRFHPLSRVQAGTRGYPSAPVPGCDGRRLREFQQGPDR